MARTGYKEVAKVELGKRRPTSCRKPGRERLDKLYIRESRSIRDIAEILGCKEDAVHHWLKKYGIETRIMAKRSKLLKYDLSELKAGIKEKGIRAYARELGVDESTLRHHTRVRN